MYIVSINIEFSWDLEKAKENLRKHKVSFEEAATIFRGHPLLVIYDPDHSIEEDRFIAFGISNKGRFLSVVHCEESCGKEIRLISARKVVKKEKEFIFGRGV